MKTSLIFAITAVLTTVDACTYSTIGQTLVAARWITPEYLLVMTHEDERNNLIYNLENVITSEQGLQGQEDAFFDRGRFRSHFPERYAKHVGGSITHIQRE